jgi:hypothetical protein
VFLVFELGFDDSMWTPPEVVMYGHGPQVVYVLDSSGPAVEAISADTRALVEFPPSALGDAKFCDELHAGLSIENKLARLPSVFQLVVRQKSGKQTTCQTVLALMSREASPSR